MKNPNYASNESWAITILRIVIGIVFAAHGAQKLFQLGIHGVAGFFGAAGIPLPLASATIVTFVEFVGGILLIAGLLTRWAAALNAFDMVVAILVVHLKNGFFDQNHGFEYPLTLLAGATSCLLWWDQAQDRWMAHWPGGREPEIQPRGWQTPKSFDIALVSQRTGLPVSFCLIFLPCKVMRSPGLISPVLPESG